MIKRPARTAAIVAGLLACIGVGLITMMVLQNGTHSVYCPAASHFWFLGCLPSVAGLISAIAVFALIWIVAFPLAWLLVRPFGRQ